MAGARLISNRERLTVAARAIAPLLNRVVLTGRQVAELLATSRVPAGRRTTFATDATLRALSTASLDRVATDLRRLGLRSDGRTATSETWRLDDRVALEVVFVPGEGSGTGGTTSGSAAIAVWLEYASLLTVAVEIEPGLSARVSGAPALVALDLAALRASDESPLDSAELEDVIALVAARAELVRELGAAPPELRTFVAGETRRFLAYDGAEHVIRSAVPPALRLPGVVARVAERLRAIAAFG